MESSIIGALSRNRTVGSGCGNLITMKAAYNSTGPRTRAMRTLLDELKRIVVTVLHVDPRGDLLEIRLAELEQGIIHEDPQVRLAAHAELRQFLWMLELGKRSLRIDRLLQRSKVPGVAAPPIKALRVNLAASGLSIKPFIDEAHANQSSESMQARSPETATNGDRNRAR